jgi:iron complex transport system ATP-binding protein
MARQTRQGQTPALSAKGLSAWLGQGPARQQVLFDVEVKIRAACWTSVVGPNGAGKSTLLKSLAGLLPHTGQVLSTGHPLSSMAPRERACALAWLAQSGGAETGANDLTVYDLALLGRLPHRPWFAGPSAMDLAAVEQALRHTQAWDWRCRPLGSLSGGERQRVLLARLLAVQAPVMLMDEPLANLDPPHQADWIDLVRELVREGRTVVSVLHEISMALMADDVLVMQGGRVFYAGPVAGAAAHAAIESVFDKRVEIRALDESWVALPR